MPDDNPHLAPGSATSRSRITNRSAVLPDVDGRSTWVRRLRDLINLHPSDLGGEDAVSEAERSIIRRVATLTVELERMESVFASAGEALTDKERGIFTKLTGRESEPLQRVEELCAVAGNSQRLSARPLDHIRPTHYRELALRPARRFV
jgi:hypothetical protein